MIGWSGRSSSETLRSEVVSVSPPRDHPGFVVATGQHDERQVRPGGLALHPTGQCGGVLSEQALLGDEHRADAGLDLGDQLGEVLAEVHAAAAAAQHFLASRSVATDRRENENPQL